MKGFKTQTQYLKEHGITNKTDEHRIERLKKTYRREYLREYRKRSRSSLKRLTIGFSKDDHRKLKLASKDHHRSLSEFIRNAAIAYIEQGYLPHDVKQIKDLTLNLQRIGNNINQITRRLHVIIKIKSIDGSTDTITIDKLKRLEKGLVFLIEQVTSIKEKVESYLDAPPPSLLSLSWEKMRSDRSRIQKVIEHLSSHLQSL